VATTLAEVLRHFGPEYLRAHALSTPQARAWRAIVSCRTAALGGQRLRCDGCGAEQWRWHSCRNRHCPQCQSRERDAWRSARLAELLNVPYGHLVFTLPHELNPPRSPSSQPIRAGWAASAPSRSCCTPGRRICVATCMCTR